MFLEIMKKSGKFSMPEIEEIKQQYDSSTNISQLLYETVKLYIHVCAK